MPHRNPAVLDTLLAGNKTFATKFSQEEPVLLKELAAGQHPKIFWLGWSVLVWSKWRGLHGAMVIAGRLAFVLRNDAHTLMRTFSSPSPQLRL